MYCQDAEYQQQTQIKISICGLQKLFTLNLNL